MAKNPINQQLNEKNANSPAPLTNEPPVKDKNGKAVTALVLGIVGLIAWVVPIAGLPVQILGLIFGVKAMHSAKRSLAIAGLVLSIVGLVLTVANISIGAYLGATGQHPLINQWTQE